LGITQLAQHLVYDAFGRIQMAIPSTPSHLFGYTGREYDTESGLSYYRARYYDAALGQFLNEDPLGFDARDANLRRYVGNGPLDATDPSGMEEAGSGFLGWLESIGANPESVQTLRALLTDPVETVKSAANPESVETLRQLRTEGVIATVRGRAQITSLPNLERNSRAAAAAADSWTMGALVQAHGELEEDPLNVLNPASSGFCVTMAAKAFFGSVFEMSPAVAQAAYDDSRAALAAKSAESDSVFVQGVANVGVGLSYFGELNTEVGLLLTQAGTVAGLASPVVSSEAFQAASRSRIVQAATPIAQGTLKWGGRVVTSASAAKAAFNDELEVRDLLYAGLAWAPGTRAQGPRSQGPVGANEEVLESVAPSSGPFADQLARVAARTPEEIADRALRADALKLHGTFERGIARNGVTVTTAELDGKMVYAVSNNRTSLALRQKAEHLGYERIFGRKYTGPLQTDAEQILLNYADDVGAQSGRLAPSRPACGPSRQNCAGRIDATPGMRLIGPRKAN
jgi:RHS repeat-associated protein